MSAQIECPICFEVVEVNRNCVTTECGHCFHANCLMQSVAHNGFGCPYCRTIMVEVPEEEDESDGYFTDDYDDDATLFDEYALTSFRMFHQQLNNEEVEEEVEEDEEWETLTEDEELPTEPNAAYVAQKLTERGITFEDLVKNVLVSEHNRYGTLYSEYCRRSSEIYGQFRAVITQYRPSEQTSEQNNNATENKNKNVVVDFDAQPKISRANLVRYTSYY